MNLADDLKNGAKEYELKKKLKKILYLRIIVTIVSCLMMLLLLNNVFNMFIMTGLLISCIAEILLSYTTDQRNWYGTGYLLKHGNIKHYLYTLPNLKVFSAKDYADYIDQTIGGVEKIHDHSYVQVFENKLYASIYEEQQPWPIDRLKSYSKIILTTTYSASWSTFTNEARKMGLKKCLGLYALLTNDDQTKQLAKDILEDHILAVKGTSAARHTESFMRFLNGEKEKIKPSQHFMVGMVNYFSHRHRIEQKIISLGININKKAS